MSTLLKLKMPRPAAHLQPQTTNSGTANATGGMIKGAGDETAGAEGAADSEREGSLGILETPESLGSLESPELPDSMYASCISDVLLPCKCSSSKPAKLAVPMHDSILSPNKCTVKTSHVVHL